MEATTWAGRMSPIIINLGPQEYPNLIYTLVLVFFAMTWLTLNVIDSLLAGTRLLLKIKFTLEGIHFQMELYF